MSSWAESGYRSSEVFLPVSGWPTFCCRSNEADPHATTETLGSESTIIYFEVQSNVRNALGLIDYKYLVALKEVG